MFQRLQKKQTQDGSVKDGRDRAPKRISLSVLMIAVTAGALISSFGLLHQTTLTARSSNSTLNSGLEKRNLEQIEENRRSFAERFLQEDTSEPQPDARFDMTELDSFGGGRLYNSNGLPLLVLRGDFFTMGVQYGALQGERIQDLLSLFDELAQRESANLLPTGLQRDLRRGLGKLFEKHFPKEIQELIRGIVEGAQLRGVTLHDEDPAFLNSLIDIAGIGSTDLSFSLDGLSAAGTLLKLARKELGLLWLNQNCNTFVAYGSRTLQGKTFQTRNTDVTTGMGLERFPLIAIFLPHSTPTDQRVPFVTAGFSGQLGASTGMNAHGVALGQVWAFSHKKAIGRPWSLSMIGILSKARTASEAAALLAESGPHTYGNNFVFGDAMGGAAALELNAENHDIFEPNDPRERLEGRMPDGRIYALPIPDAVVRGDLSLSRRIRIDQTSANGPWGYPPDSGSYKKRYAGQVKRILAYERLGRKIGAKEAMVISRATASRKHGNLQNAVYANTDRKLWVAYASYREADPRKAPSDAEAENSHQKILVEAYESPFIYVPFDQILQQEGFEFPQMPSTPFAKLNGQ